MRLLLDQGLPRTAVPQLRLHGIDAVHVGELGMSAATDEEILDEARSQQAVVITLDADFHSLLATHIPHPLARVDGDKLTALRHLG